MKSKNIFLSLALASSLGLSAYADETSAPPDLSSLPPEQAAGEIIRLNDRDGNKTLSKEEVDLGFRLSRFKDVDQNADGQLDQAELTRSYAQAAEARKRQEANNASKPPQEGGFLNKIKKQLSAL